MKVSFTGPRGVSFDAYVAEKLADSPSGSLHEARRLSGTAALPEQIVVKRALPGTERLLEVERAVCETLDHPGVAGFLGWGFTPNGSALAFERLGQNPLLLLNAPARRPTYRDPWTELYPLPLGRALELAMDTLLALEQIHARRYVHGAIKPTTIFVRVPGPSHDAASVLRNVAEGAFEGVIGGLGAARSLDFFEKLRRRELDQALAPAVDPALTAPEVAAPRGGEPARGPAMDIYGFGLLLYTLITGRRPFDHLRAVLGDPAALAAARAAEARGELGPIDPRAVERIPLHDTPLDGVASQAWSELGTKLVHLLGWALRPDPAERCTAGEAREFFQAELGLHPQSGRGRRAWVARSVQMRARVNRLAGDEPSGGVSIKHEAGALVVEEKRPVPARAAAPADSEGGEEVLVRFKGVRAADPAAAPAPAPEKRPAFPEAPKGMVYLGAVLRELQAKRPLPVDCPVLLTSTAFGKKELAQCLIFSLGRASARLVEEDAGRREAVRVVVGRGDGSDVVLNDGSVSKRHLALERRDGFWWVEDLGSTNGSGVDGFAIPKNGRVRIRGRLASIEAGDAKLTYMEEPELKVFLENALAAWIEAFGTGKKPTASVERAPAAASAAAVEPPTVKRPRDFAKIDKKTSLSVSVPGALPQDLAERLAWHAKSQATFRIILRGSRVEEPDDLAEALDIVKRQASDILSVEAIERDGGSVLLFRRPSPDDSEEQPALSPGGG